MVALHAFHIQARGLLVTLVSPVSVKSRNFKNPTERNLARKNIKSDVKKLRPVRLTVNSTPANTLGPSIWRGLAVLVSL